MPKKTSKREENSALTFESGTRVSGQMVMWWIICFIEEARWERCTVEFYQNLVELEVHTCGSSGTDGWAVRT